MLAARVDQENAVHARQTAAAAKPLNQGVKGFAPKTPGNRAPKTPFKVALNDENEVDKFGKGGFGTNGKGLGGKQQGGKVEKNLFQTPAPRERPALGFKTTNAKATVFQTPAPKLQGPSPEKTQRRTAGRSRIQIHKEVKEAEPEIDWGNEEIQYVPPRPTPLPDVPSDDEWDKIDFSILKTGNFERGRIAEYYARKQAKEDAEEAQWRKEEQERMKKEDEEFFKKATEDLREPEYNGDVPIVKAMAPLRQQSKPLGTLTARSAASALAKPTKIPSYAVPTAATKAKAPTDTTLGHKKNTSFSANSGANVRAASYNTLGYVKGRAVSNILRREPASGIFKDQPQQAKLKKKDPLKELEEMISAREYEDAGIKMHDLDDFSEGGVSLDDEDEEIFQMKIPDA